VDAEIKNGCLVIRIPVFVLVDRGKKTKPLSKRERQVLELLLEGSSNKEIANKVGLSERTIKFHISALLKKNECANRTQLVYKFAMMRREEEHHAKLDGS